MQLRALMVVRAIVFVALLPALAGCASPSDDEPLARGDIEAGPAPESGVVTPPWAALDEATIRPGALIHTEKRDCPSNFFFVREDNGAVFLGTTSYCVRDLPIGAIASIGEDASAIGALVYSSMQTMAEIGEDDPNAIEYNDLALFHLDSAAVRRSNPTLVGVDGPRGLADAASHEVGARIRSFSHSSQLPASSADWREGIVSGQAGDWALLTYHALPGAPGELGGPAIDPDGNAVGILVTLGVVPNPGANGVARLDTMLAYADEHARLGGSLATSS